MPYTINDNSNSNNNGHSFSSAAAAAAATNGGGGGGGSVVSTTKNTIVAKVFWSMATQSIATGSCACSLRVARVEYDYEYDNYYGR